MDALKVQERVAIAREIADKLIADANRNQHGLYWDFVSQTTDLQPVWAQSENMYSGSSGVAWFFFGNVREDWG